MVRKDIKEIPGEDGWWKSSAEKYFNEVAKKMIDKGFTKEETIEILDKIYWEVSSCYGG